MHITKKNKEVLTAEQLAEIENEQKKLAGQTAITKKSGRKTKWADADVLSVRLNHHTVDYIDQVVAPELRSIWSDEGNRSPVGRVDAIIYLMTTWHNLDTQKRPTAKKTSLEPHSMMINTSISVDALADLDTVITPAIQSDFWQAGEKGRITRRMAIEHLVDVHKMLALAK